MKALTLSMQLAVIALFIHTSVEGKHSSSGTIGTFTVRNTTPYTVYAVFNFQITTYKHHTIGWYKLAPGEERKIKKTYHGIRPNISVYAQSASSEKEVMGFVFGDQAGKNRIRYLQASNDDDYIIKSIHPSSKVDYVSYGGDYLEETGYEGVYFEKIEAIRNENGQYRGTFNLVDDYFAGIYVDGETAEFGIRAKELSKSIKRQIAKAKHLKTTSDLPFLLGLNIDDHNGPFDLGVRISEVVYKTNILGQPVQYRDNDILLSLDGHPVFSLADVNVLVTAHGASLKKGINVPVQYTLLRDDEIVTGESLYFFNPFYDSWPESDKTSAIISGCLEGITLGFLERAITDPKIRWNYIQNRARYHQFYPNQVILGELTTFIISPARAIFQKGLKRTFIRKGLSQGASSIASVVALESGETLIWSINSKHPSLSQSEFKRQLKDNLAFSAGLGFISASWFQKKI